MRKILPILIVLGLGYLALDRWQAAETAPQDVAASGITSDSAISQAFASRTSGVLVEGRGHVIRVLPDDTDGDRHQRFILRLDSGQTLLVAHNIDLASRLPRLKVGDLVEFSGQYEWNDQGGVIHWTHEDPSGRHRAGWLKYRGEKYH
jgi:hypothetical protein